MRSLCALASVALVSCLSMPGVADDARRGQFLSVRVEGAPVAVTSARCRLGDRSMDFELRSRGQGVWAGSFAILPQMMKGEVRPQVMLLDAEGNEIPITQGDGTQVTLSGTSFDEDSLATVMCDRTALFVYDDSVDVSSIRLWSNRQSEPIMPEFGNGTFALPWGIAPLTISTITANTRNGRTLSFRPEWDRDVATVEEPLELLP